MKKLLNILLFLLIATISFSDDSYPFKNPYVATIFGSSQMMTPEIPKNIDIEDENIDMDKEIPEQFWYSDGFKFSYVKQDKKAPLVFILAGTGATHNSTRNKLFARIFYKYGYNVILLPSIMNGNFVLNASKTKMPGIIFDDSQDMYNIMKKSYEKIKDEMHVSNFYLIGYSLGATEAGMISYIDENEKFFDFKRVFMVNPAVDAYKSAIKLDDFVAWKPDVRAKKMRELIEKIEYILKKNTNSEMQKMDEEAIFKAFSKTKMSDNQMKELIGAAFRLTSMNLNYVVDIANSTNVYNKPVDSKFRPNFNDFKNINFASFDDYINLLAMPNLMKKYNLDQNEIFTKARLHYIEDYLRNSKKIGGSTNEDELILDKEDIKFLKDTMGDRIIIYKYGGHCGNMFYYENVMNMIKFLKAGEITYEN